MLLGFHFLRGWSDITLVDVLFAIPVLVVGLRFGFGQHYFMCRLWTWLGLIARDHTILFYIKVYIQSV